MVALPVAMTDAALVNTVMTVTEAKTQAMLEAGFAGTGTASDAVCVAARADGPQELFGGPPLGLGRPRGPRRPHRRPTRRRSVARPSLKVNLLG
ncbi:adenosylcobinamide amidohydrolase [Nonomuraea salmonea]|uniref:adenosylcobinamide amidohydrolase n=1 Tax=Nonomuraea salmonea TaxID=46181 RepID=UPI002FEDC95A